MTEIIKIGAQSSGGGSSKLFEILTSDTQMPILEFDEYVGSAEGLQCISELNSLPEIWTDNILHYLMGSDSFLSAVFANVDLGISLILREGIYLTLFANTGKLEKFFVSPTNKYLLESCDLHTFFRNEDYMYHAVAIPMAMRKIAQSNILLGLAFNSSEKRIRMFDVGGKEVSDILMREFPSARSYLSSISIQKNYQQNQTYSSGKRGYLLEVWCSSSSTGGTISSGEHLGDYRTGTVVVSSLTKDHVVINERAHPVKYRMDYGYTTHYVYGRYVDME